MPLVSIAFLGLSGGYNFKLVWEMGLCRSMTFIDEYMKALEAYYDVHRNIEYASEFFDGYAEFHAENSSYVLSKRAKLWSANTHEYIFCKRVCHIDADEMERLVGFAKSEGFAKVVPEPDHMSSSITFVIVVDSADDAVRSVVKKAKLRKNIKCGFQGWIDLRVALVELHDKRITSNRMGKELADTLSGLLKREDVRE